MLVHPVAQKVKFQDTQYTLFTIMSCALGNGRLHGGAPGALGGAGDENVVNVVVHEREAS